MTTKAASMPVLRPYLLVLPVVIYLALFFLYPVFEVFWLGFTDPHPGLAGYREFFSHGFYLDALLRTFRVAFFVTLACLLLGYPTACIVARASGRLAPYLLAAITIAFWTSYLVKAYAWMIILGGNGPVDKFLTAIGIAGHPRLIYNTTGVYIALIHAMLPYMILTIYAVVRRIDGHYLRASAGLGASPWQQFRTVFLPLSLPGVVNGCTLVFIFTLGFYSTPALLGGPRDMMLPGMIGQQINELLQWGVAGAMTSLLILCSVAIFAVYNRLFGLNRLWG